MRAEKDLQPSDAALFDCFLFGGILGDHPPRDRSKPLRDKGYTMRKLRELQLATDTAVLVTRLIIEDQIPIENIPFVDNPDFEKPVEVNG